MAAKNEFATMLHRNTNKITLILIYALLEWILILLLLLNSLFSYLIIKFAEFFGLQPPCLWCTRVDRMLDHQKGHKNMHRDLLCEVHATEISKLGYCSNHHKLAESQDMCEHCLCSSPELEGLSETFSLFPCVKEFGVIQNQKEKVGDNGEESLQCCCCCCGARLDNTMYSSYIPLKTSSSSWEEEEEEDDDDDDDVLECVQKENLITEAGDGCHSDKKLPDFAADGKVLEDKNESEMLSELNQSIQVTEKEVKERGSVLISASEMNDKSVQACTEEDAPVEIPPQHLEIFLDYSGHKLVDLITGESNRRKDIVKIQDDGKVEDQVFGEVCAVPVEEEEDLAMKHRSGLERMEVVIHLDINEVPKSAMLDSMELEEDENSLVFHARDFNLAMEEFEQFTNFPVSQIPSEDVRDAQEMDVAAREMHLDVHTGPTQIKEQIVELRCVSVQDDMEYVLNNQPSFRLELNEIEEDKIPDTPTSPDGLNQLHIELGFLEKRDSEESLDGRIMSELECSDGVFTTESLKSALREERKNLQALYAELEEERSASAVAANQTMAMINRLQEEKAAMQMEALQYQRMMEEQSEYDQEALQLMNDLMVKREKEKQELEKELGVYRKKLLHYETVEKIRVLKKRNGSTRSGFSPAFCSNTEESDGLSIDLNQEAKEEECSYGRDKFGNHDTPVDTVMILEESLVYFEEERLSIVVQLKVLEEKLILLDDNIEQQFEDVKAMGDFPKENGNHEDESAHFNGEANGWYLDGFGKEMNGKHHQQRRIACQEGKSFLPPFDAIGNKNGDMFPNGNGNRNGFDLNGVHDSDVSKLEMESKKLAIDEEMDHLYERLQALEADREFIKHCVSSLKKGDKGMELLQEIMQHLRDLRNIELHGPSLKVIPSSGLTKVH